MLKQLFLILCNLFFGLAFLATSAIAQNHLEYDELYKDLTWQLSTFSEGSPEKGWESLKKEVLTGKDISPQTYPFLLGTARTCYPDLARLILNMQTYFQAAGQNNSKISDKFYSEIQSLLLTHYNQASPCFEDLSKMYLVLSINQLENANTDNRIYDERPTTTWLTFFFMSQGKIKFLTPKKREDLGCQYLQRGKNLFYEIFAFYNCLDSTIYVDPFMAPFNLAGSFLHELDHLMRDKLIPISSDYYNPSEWVLLDEVLASMYTGFLQKKSMGDVYFQTLGHQFHNLDNDNQLFRHGKTKLLGLTLINRDGPLVKMMEELSKLSSTIGSPTTDVSVFLSYVILNPVQLINEDYLLYFSPFQEATGREAVTEIFQIVSKAYFPGVSFEFSKFEYSSEFAMSHDLRRLDPLSEWTFRYDGRNSIAKSRSGTDNKLNFLENLDLLKATVDSPSQSCLQIVDSPEMQTYIGNQFENTCQSHNGSGNGNEGGRTGKKGAIF